MTHADISLIQEELLVRINEKMEELNFMQPIPADTLAKLHEEMRLVQAGSYLSLQCDRRKYTNASGDKTCSGRMADYWWKISQRTS